MVRVCVRWRLAGWWWRWWCRPPFPRTPHNRSYSPPQPAASVAAYPAAPRRPTLINNTRSKGSINRLKHVAVVVTKTRKTKKKNSAAPVPRARSARRERVIHALTLHRMCTTGHSKVVIGVVVVVVVVAAARWPSRPRLMAETRAAVVAFTSRRRRLKGWMGWRIKNA